MVIAIALEMRLLEVCVMLGMSLRLSDRVLARQSSEAYSAAIQ